MWELGGIRAESFQVFQQSFSSPFFILSSVVSAYQKEWLKSLKLHNRRKSLGKETIF